MQGLPVLILPFPLLNGLFYFDFFSLLVKKHLKYMVATGICNTKTECVTEIIDVSNPMKSCVLNDNNILSKGGKPRYYSSGGTLGTTPVICGG